MLLRGVEVSKINLFETKIGLTYLILWSESKIQIR